MGELGRKCQSFSQTLRNSKPNQIVRLDFKYKIGQKGVIEIFFGL